MNKITRLVALPLISAGIIGGAAVGLAGTASAQVTHTETNGSHSIVARPDTIARHVGSILPNSHRHHHHHNNPWR